MSGTQRPDAVCPSRPAHKVIEVAYAEPADRTLHWHCHTPVSGGFCHTEWVTPWRDTATFTDEALEGLVKQFAASLDQARRALRDALLATERAVHVAAEADEPDVTERIYVALRKAERLARSFEAAREDLRVWRIQRDMQLSRRDTASSASRQHYIDTGNYLDLREAATVDG